MVALPLQRWKILSTEIDRANYCTSYYLPRMIMPEHKKKPYYQQRPLPYRHQIPMPFDLWMRDFEMLLGKIRAAEPYDLIVGVAQNGLVLALQLQKHLIVPMVPLLWSRATHRFDRDCAWIRDAVRQRQRILLVDNSTASGITVGGIRSEYGHMDMATLVHNTASTESCQYWARAYDRGQCPTGWAWWWEPAGYWDQLRAQAAKFGDSLDEQQ